MIISTNFQSFYFPRMGRSGDDSSNSAYCCPEGVRKVFTVGKGAIEICSNDKSCCPGYTEQNKVYQDIVITECAEVAIFSAYFVVNDEDNILQIYKYYFKTIKSTEMKKQNNKL